MANGTDFEHAAGLPVDKYGGATIDPTRNVLDLVEASVKRLDDLRDVENRRIEEKIADEKTHIREILELNSLYGRELTVAEAKRIDAIRVVDVNAVAVAAERSTQQATVLATQVSASAETLRALVATTATTAATQAQQNNTQLSDRIALLEKNQYQGAGRESVTDPAMVELTANVKALVAISQQNIGKGQGLSQGWVVLLGAVGLIATILGIFMILSRFIP
jgi:hypothetical protein